MIGTCSGRSPTTYRFDLTTSRKVAPAAARHDCRLANVFSTCARRSPLPTTSPRSSVLTCPETYTVLPPEAETTCVQPFVGIRPGGLMNCAFIELLLAQAGQHCDPPSTRITCPLMNRPSSPARKATTEATSCGCP